MKPIKPIPAIILVPLIAHPIWGAMMILSPTPVHTVGIDSIYRLTNNPIIASIGVLLASVLAIASHRPSWHGNWKGFLCMAPQQFLMLLSAYMIIVCVATGRYADGYVPNNGWRFIASDQVFLFIACILHTKRVWETYIKNDR